MKDFLVGELPDLLDKLKPGAKGSFGIMTPQHMVEHLIVVVKSMAKKYDGEREMPPNKRQLGFQKFIRNGCVMEHRPSNKTIADLPTLKYESLDEAVAVVPEAVQRFYKFWEDYPTYKPYFSFMGEVTFEELEIFHFNHFKYHLWQFGLIENYP